MLPMSKKKKDKYVTVTSTFTKDGDYVILGNNQILRYGPGQVWTIDDDLNHTQIFKKGFKLPSELSLSNLLKKIL